MEPEPHIFHHHATVARSIVARFAAGTKQVPLVVPGNPARRLHEKHPVAELPVFGDDDAAHDSFAVLCRPAPHGRSDKPVGRLGDTGGAQFEPRGEHFGQHGNISIGRRNDRLQTFQVPGGMFPFHVDLADSNTYFHRKTPFCKQIYKIFLQIAPAGIKNMEVCKAGRQQREPGIQNGHAGRHPCGSAYGSAMKSNAGKQGAGSRSQPAKAHGPATVCPDELPERPDAAGKKQPARQTALH